MKVTVITPENGLVYDQKTPCVFLAGPCAGSRSWHDEVFKFFKDLDLHEEIVFFNPVNPSFKSLEEQSDWETRHLNYAYDYGLVSFFLADKETDIPNRGYARTTRFELGEWIARYKYMDGDKTHKLTIGCEDNFEGKDYILHRLTKNYGLKINKEMKDFCEDIIINLIS